MLRHSAGGAPAYWCGLGTSGGSRCVPAPGRLSPKSQLLLLLRTHGLSDHPTAWSVGN